jgi:hypothetical protein
MDIQKYVDSFIQQINADCEKELVGVREKAFREKINPFNQEIERSKVESIQKLNSWLVSEREKLTAIYNKSCQDLQAKYDNDKKIIEETAEKRKDENAKAVLATECYAITSKRDKAIAKLNSIKDIKE